MESTTAKPVTVKGELFSGTESILTEEALEFVAFLHRKYNARRKELLEQRMERQRAIDQGEMPDFPEETAEIRNSEWKVAPIPQDLQDRRVEITGPVDRKMVINALNSGANMFMADFEDSSTPSWESMVHGQINLRDAANGSIKLEDEAKGKVYQLKDAPATLLVRPRGWHMEDKHLIVDGESVSASLMDFGLFFFHNARTLIDKGSGPYFYLPKMESHLEARLWNDVFKDAQDYLGIPQGTIKATVLIETILATFELDEILYELKEHSAGLNCGRWDYIFSYIKRFQSHREFLLPDRAQVTMTVPFMRAYSQLVIKVCHRRGAHAIGGMAAQIPTKDDEEANKKAFEKVTADKEREANDGHDGTWVAHPGLIPVAKEAFDNVMPNANQIEDKKRDDVQVDARDLIAVPEGEITEAGMINNIDVGIQYIESWLRGIGCVPIYYLMEDTATAEICRAQIWQWLKHPDAKLNDGRPIDMELYRELKPKALERTKKNVGEELFENGRFNEAIEIFEKLATSDEFEEFLTTPAYRYLD